jgi:hypothetical protein
VQEKGSQQKIAKIERQVDFQVQEDAEKLPDYQLLLFLTKEDPLVLIRLQQRTSPRNHLRGA